MKSWKSKIVLFVVFTISVCGFARAARGGEAGESGEVDGKHTIWRVSSEKNSIYVVGSIHLLKKDNYPLAPVMEKAFEESQVLVLELDPSEANDPGARQLTLAKAMLPEGETLEKQIEKETYSLASEKSSELGLDITGFQKFKPWFFVLTLTMTKFQALGFDPDLGLDMYFHSKAVEADKEVIGLETFEFQINLLDGLSKYDQDQFVHQAMRDLEIIEAEMDKIVKAWTTGDVKTVEELILKSFRDYPAIFELLVTKRTKNWVPEIESLLKGEKTCLVVVGVGHLVGDEGLAALLKEKGYTVEQL